MSHFTRIKTKITDTTLLVGALERLGVGPVEVYDAPQRLRGFGDQAASAEVIIRRERLGAIYGDLGFARSTDGGFTLIVDETDRRSERMAWLAELPRTYGYLAALSYAEAHGFQVTEEELEQDGTRRLVLRR